MTGSFSALGVAYVLVALTFLKAGILVLGDPIRLGRERLLFRGRRFARVDRSPVARPPLDGCDRRGPLRHGWSAFSAGRPGPHDNFDFISRIW